MLDFPEKKINYCMFTKKEQGNVCDEDLRIVSAEGDSLAITS